MVRLVLHCLLFNFQALFYSAVFHAVGDFLFFETFFFFHLASQKLLSWFISCLAGHFLVQFLGFSSISHLKTFTCGGLSFSLLLIPCAFICLVTSSSPHSYVQPGFPLCIQNIYPTVTTISSRVSLLPSGSSLEYCSDLLLPSCGVFSIWQPELDLLKM